MIYDEALKDNEELKEKYTTNLHSNMMFDNIRDALLEAKKQLEAPTSDEVCKDIEYWLYKCIGKSDPYIKYVNETKSFVYECNGEFKDLITFYDGYITFKQPFPPHLITLIGRFYEKELANDNT